MAREDETALMLKTQADEMEMKNLRKQLTEVKKNSAGLPAVVDGAVTVVAGTAIGVLVGSQHGGDAAKRDAQMGYAGGLAAVLGIGGAVFAGPNNPRARSALADIGVAGLTVAGFQFGEAEGVKMKLAALKAAPPTAGAAAPGVQGYGRPGTR